MRRPVKSATAYVPATPHLPPAPHLPFRPAAPGAARIGLRRLVGVPVLALGVLVAATSFADLLLGGRLGPAPPREPPPLDGRIPRGSALSTPARPESVRGESPTCSLHGAPVCVHRAPGVEESAVLSAIYEMDRVYRTLLSVFGLPPHLDDGDRGGSSALDLYLVPGQAELTVEVDAVDPVASGDVASAYCVLGADERALERAATLCLGEASALRLDASETPSSRRALATELWLATGEPTSADALALDDFQAAPERALVTRERSRTSEGSALFLEFLDAVKGFGEPGAVGLATYALSAGARSASALTFTNEPDTLDVLRSTFGPKPSDVARLFGDFAVARALLGTRDGEGHWPSLEWVGEFGRPRFEWSVPLSSLPRRLAPSRPVEPTGTTYLWVSTDGDASGGIALRAEWEPPVAFKWEIVLVAADGRMLRRIDVPYLERETSVERMIGDLSGSAGVLIVGTNLGGLGPSYPFDPDFEPFEPHGYDVYLARQ